jgi:D-alanine transaminase
LARIAFVNGRYTPHRDAMVHIEDRGYQFSDGVYEVCEIRGGRIVDERRHMERLTRSLAELRIAAPMSSAALAIVMRECVRRNRVRDGVVYLQVTRGVARRDHGFPPPGTVPRVAVALLPNVLAKQAAREKGAKEAWFVDHGGYVTEGSSSNAWIVTKGGKVVTRQADNGILRGITRTVLVEVIKAQGLELEERPFTADEAYGAREAFITSASQIVMPVVRIDDRAIGNGAPGLISTALREAFHRHAEWS